MSNSDSSKNGSKDQVHRQRWTHHICHEIQYDDRRTFEVMPSGADGELPQTNGKLLIRNKTSSCSSQSLVIRDFEQQVKIRGRPNRVGLWCPFIKVLLGQMRRRQSPNRGLFSDNTTYIQRKVRLNDLAKCRSFILTRSIKSAL